MRASSHLGLAVAVLVSACGSSVPGSVPGSIGTRVASLGIGSSADDLRTGWYPNQPSLNPNQVSGPGFAQLFDVAVDGQIYAQPLVFPGGLLVATENNHVYVLDPVTGAALAERALETPWNAADLGCGDLVPNVGITGTPVIDPTTSTAYLTTKTYAAGTSGPAALWLHALALPALAETSGLPGADPGRGRQPDRCLLRPHPPAPADRAPPAGRAHLCRVRKPLRHQPLQGLDLRGLSTAGQIEARWSAEDRFNDGAGIWQAGGALMSDGPGTFIVVHRNGEVSAGPDSRQHSPQRPRTGMGPPHRPAQPHACRH